MARPERLELPTLWFEARCHLDVLCLIRLNMLLCVYRLAYHAPSGFIPEFNENDRILRRTLKLV